MIILQNLEIVQLFLEKGILLFHHFWLSNGVREDDAAHPRHPRVLTGDLAGARVSSQELLRFRVVMVEELALTKELLQLGRVEELELAEVVA